MSIDKMKVFFRCPNCRHEEILMDYHENTSSDRYEYLVVLNMDDRAQYDEVLKDGKFYCKKCGESVPFDRIFQNGYCSVEDINAYLELFVSNLSEYIQHGHFAFSSWHYGMTPFPSLDRLCCMYPDNQDLRKLQMVYKNALSYGKNGLKQYTKAELWDETVRKGCVLFPSLLKKVYLHDSVKHIGEAAFCGCSSLPDIYLPSDVTLIDEDAFRGCRSLKTIHMPDGLTRIEKRAFYGCHSLGSIYISKNLSFIGEEAFIGCISLKRIWLPHGVTIGKNAFAGCLRLSLIEVSDSMDKTMLSQAGILPEATIIRYTEENGCDFEKSGDDIPEIESIECVVYPDGTKAIDKTTFTLSFWKNIKHVSIPSSVTRIGNSAFDNCKEIQEIELPEGLTFIGSTAFMYCSRIRCMKIPEGVKKILRYTFAMCSELETISLPPFVTEIGEYAFEYCSRLSAIVFPDSLESIGEHAFYSCKSLETVRIPSKVKEIGKGAFAGCSSLKTLHIENGVYQIEYGAFEATSVLSVFLPESIAYVEKHAFDRCVSLQYFDVSELNQNYMAQNKSLYLKKTSTLYICPRGMDGEYNVAQGTKEIGWGAFSGCERITKINLPFGVTEIGPFAFSGCTNLLEISIPNSIELIDAGAFYKMDSLKTIKYQGTSEQWEKINIDMNNNELLESIEIVYDLF